MSRFRRFLDGLATVVCVLAVASVPVTLVVNFEKLTHQEPRPPEPPHVASDCRAACTLEGLALVGVEIQRYEHPRCLCAPVSP